MTSSIITIVLILALVVFELVRKNRIPIDAFRMSLVIYGLVYIIIPELLPMTYGCEPFCNGVPWPPRVVSIVGLGALIAGYFLSQGLPVFKTVCRARANDRTEYRFILLVLLLSIAALYVYASSFGGFLNAISYGAVLRYTGAKNMDIQGSVVALYLIGMVYVVLVISQYKLYQTSKYKNKYRVVLFCAVVVVLSYSLINASRGAIFNIVMLMMFIHFNVRGLKVTPRKIILVIAFFSFGLMITTYGKSVIGLTASIFRSEDESADYSSIEKKEATYVFGRTVMEFSHPIKSIGVVLDHDLDYNLMKHFILAPLHLVPTRLLGLSDVKPFRITEINTYLLTGDSEGGIPPGLVASFWYGGGLVGVLTGCMLFGGFIGWLQRQCYSFLSAYPSSMPIVLYIFFRVAWFINNGDLSVFLKHLFHFLIFLMVLIIFNVIRRIKLSQYRFAKWRKLKTVRET